MSAIILVSSSLLFILTSSVRQQSADFFVSSEMTRIVICYLTKLNIDSYLSSLCSKNVVYNYTDAEVKVREATSNDPWGPSGSVMAELAEFTFHV